MRVRYLESEDKSSVLTARNKKINREASLGKSSIGSDEHDIWFKKVLESKERLALAFEFQGEVAYYFTVDLGCAPARVGAIRARDNLPHPVVGALLPLLVLEAVFCVENIEKVQTETLLTNRPLTRSRQLLGINSFGKVTSDGSLVRQELSRSDFHAARSILWNNAQKMFGDLVDRIKAGIVIES